MTRTAIVVGGSLAGLMHGIILKENGFKVQVLERSAPEVLDSEAAGIRAGPEVHDFIEQHVRPSFDYAVTAEKAEIVDGDGNVVDELPFPDPLRLTTWKIIYDMLKGALLEAVNGQQVATYETRQMVQDVQLVGEKVEVKVLDLEKATSTSIEGDLVIAADGAHSAIRKKLCPEVKPQYAGYVTWRGRVPETAVSPQTREALRNRCMILRVEGGYQISYYVPSDADPKSSRRDFVWIWYDNLVPDSQEFTETMTDVDGKLRHSTIPRGKMDPIVWQRAVARKSTVVNPHFIHLMESITEPFVTAISDFAGQRSVFFDGRLLLVGDAFTLCRPHGGGSTSQAAFRAQTLDKALRGEITLEQWEETCLAEAKKAAMFSLAMAEFFWRGKVEKAESEAGGAK
ncbi:hypothetical protein HBI24_119850 [Parastagonospora nodorum]|nr:hypothetical protein HBH52_251060 [Parastagonospora nodorum]KAH4009551.1 hypothetical protein HBI09_235100 [Parastagonospora nodorum]KAH4046622.1 hypothetical protein HBH49_185750 [Parastagonospora nodorum]KAH4062071.1 hypothetical protein HBH50_214250 [Parastagonospora nodorum]KAH4077128.1 hypothetical protein HBH46_243820 [Parastagonospora nodorum]